jgi:hypothetical protein
MVSALITRWKAHQAKNQIERHPILGPAHKFIVSILNDPKESLFQLTDENKDKTGDQLFQDVIETLSDSNPILAVRKRLTNYTGLAAYAVVAIGNPGQNECPEVTGELKARLPELIKVSDALKNILTDEAEKLETVEDITASLTAKCLFYDLWMRTYNYVRILIDDFYEDKKKDWFAPYKIAQLIFCEYTYRKALKMPTNIRTGDPLTEGAGEMIAYGEFETIILAGHKDPRAIFEGEWMRICHYTCPLADIT